MIVDVKRSQRISEASLDSLNAVVLSGRDFFPPHIGLVVSGQYFSCTAKGVKLGIPFPLMFQTFKRKKFKLVFAHLNVAIPQKNAVKEFTDYGKLEHGKTCLFPVKNTIENATAKTFKARFVFELLPLLKKEEILTHYSHYRLEESIVADSFILPTYSRKEIQTCINEIQLVDEK